RFFTDCLDGKVARAQGSTSARGALFDITADVTGISLAVAALGWHLMATGDLSPMVALGLLAALVVYNWALAHRKHLAERLGVGDGGSPHAWHPSLPVLRSWVALCRRLNMSVIPWVLEAEILALGLAPLLLPAPLVAQGLIGFLVFYLVADTVNLRRLWRIAAALDARADPVPLNRAVPTGTVKEHP
ncbi:CDP-alcohol phosphatidyltransferase family protein, partial [Nocardioides sp.]|uniref:CDP-alcohol phosphatidyltransferase family protein n=1 Tax=Nocardioides sp. TaxID=35761 RepID=UPI0027350A89